MNCNKILELISDKFSGGVSQTDELQIRQHITTCNDCRARYDQEKLISESLKSLDSTKYRDESIESFGRLAVAVRSHRSTGLPLPGILRIKPTRLAWVASLLLVILVGLSNLSVSYSYTSGANLRIDFNPPLQKSESIQMNEFYTRINDTLNTVLNDPENPGNIAWAVNMESDSLSGISIDIETDQAVDIAQIYGSLMEDYPSFARGVISIGPLKENQKESAFRMITSRKKDEIDIDDLKRIVDTDFPKIIAKVERKIRFIEKEGDEIQEIIEQELPTIRDLINSVSEKNIQNWSGVDITTMIKKQDGGAQENVFYNEREMSKEILDGIEKIVIAKGIDTEGIDLDKIIGFKMDGNISRIIIGDTNSIFEPWSVGGRKISIIRGSGSEVDLNGVENLVKSEEVDSLLSGKIKPEDLENSINTRALNSATQNETVVIEVFKGEKKAEITIRDGDASVLLTSPPELEIEIMTPDLDQIGNKNDLNDLLEWKKKLESEREVVLKHFESEDEPEITIPPPSFSNDDSFTNDFVTDDEIKSFVKGALSADVLEKRIENRIQEKKLKPGNRNIAFIREGKLITISINEGVVTVDLSSTGIPGMGAGSIMVTHKNAESRSEGNETGYIDIIAEQIITESEIEDILTGNMHTWLAENTIAQRLDDKFGDKWTQNMQSSFRRTKNGKTIMIEVKDGKVQVTIE